MSLVVDLFRSLIPSRAKSSPSGWTSFNAPCCHHRGHSQDKRKRGGLRFDNGIVYNCFNCKYTASWQPGRPLSEKFKSLCRWMGANDDDIKKMVFEALKTESPEYEYQEHVDKVTFEKKDLPEGSLPLKEWAEMLDQLPEDLQSSLVQAIQYINDRGHDPYSEKFYWSPLAGFESRVILPFYFQKQLVGYTARKFTDGKLKYLSDQHPHFVFNVDEQKEDQRYILVCEGPFDALAVNGLALLTNGIADQQARILNGLGSEILVIPDQDRAGLELIDKAIHYNFSVAFPNWEDDVKDVAEAVQRYGKLFVVVDAIKSAQQGEIKITMAKKQLEKKIKAREDYEKNN
jgi:hypothetical protein